MPPSEGGASARSPRDAGVARDRAKSFAPGAEAAEDGYPMSAVLITGCSAAGKSTLAAVLTRRGLASLDSDADPTLARSVDVAGNVVEEPAAPDFEWLARHSWQWNPQRLDELIRAAAPSTLYVCGGAANELQLADRFDRVFFLEIDEATMLARLDAPERDNDWGRIGDTRAYLRRFLPDYQDRLRAFGAIPVDATQPLDQVVDAILAHAGRSRIARTGLLFGEPAIEPSFATSPRRATGRTSHHIAALPDVDIRPRPQHA
jgi:adenylate kinase family enzyme